jgi:hypothetical protein
MVCGQIPDWYINFGEQAQYTPRINYKLGSHLVTMAEKGSDKVEIVGLDDKREITGKLNFIGITWFLSMYFIYL